MFTLKLFDGLTKSVKRKKLDKDLAAWARIEYKNDADFAYFYMVEYGVAPGVKSL